MPARSPEPSAVPVSAAQLTARAEAELRVRTLGEFRVWRAGEEIPATAWGRDKALQLFQFFVTHPERRWLKEQVIEQLWPELEPEAGDRDFKVALSTLHATLEPDRAPRSEPRFVRRYGTAYGLTDDGVWIDASALEANVAAGNRRLGTDRAAAIEHYRAAAALYGGDYLPERRYEDWSSPRHERLQTLAFATMGKLAELVLDENPLESIQLTQRVLAVDPVWEDAWRVQMQAYLARGNRGLALRAWQRCVEALERELGLAPLPETRAVYEQIQSSDEAAQEGDES